MGKKVSVTDDRMVYFVYSCETESYCLCDNEELDNRRSVRRSIVVPQNVLTG